MLIGACDPMLRPIRVFRQGPWASGLVLNSSQDAGNAGGIAGLPWSDADQVYKGVDVPEHFEHFYLFITAGRRAVRSPGVY